MTIRCLGITSQRADSRHRARLGMDIPVSLSLLHAMFQGAIHTGYRQCFVEWLENVGMIISILQVFQQQTRRNVIVQRDTTSIYNIIIIWIKS